MKDILYLPDPIMTANADANNELLALEAILETKEHELAAIQDR